MALTDYLKRRGHTYYVRVQIPKPLWPAAGGKREFVKSLKTRDLGRANQMKHAHVAVFQSRIRALARVAPDASTNPLAEVHAKALSLRNSWDKLKDEEPVYYDFDPEQPYYPSKEATEDAILDEARDLEESHGDEVAATFLRIAKGEGTPLHGLIDTWLAEHAGTITAQTSAQHRTVLTALLKWTGQGLLVEDVHRRKAGEFVSHLLSPASGLKRKTVQRYVSSLSSLWRWLMARGVAASNPWLGHDIGRKSKRGQATTRKQWTDAALVKLLSGHYSPRYTPVLHDLIRLALVTGARLDELCALETEDAHRREDGWWVSIRQGKTDAAVRDIPLHRSAVHVIERRKSADGFIFHGLIPGGPDKKRSWNASKAFGLYTKKLDLGEQRQVFHALRNTFTEAMEQAEVPESTTALIIGHKRASLTYGHYSKGERVKLRSAIDKLKYAPEVMRLIQGARSPRGRKRR
jgi:integrase